MAAAVLGGVPIGEGSPVRLMAVINVSPESFYAGSVHADASALHDAVQKAAGEGADLIDIGAMSSAPYKHTALPVEDEVRRMIWAVRIAAAAVTIPVSADTARASVAAAALAHGARVINDVTGFRGDAAMADIAATADGVVLMAAPMPGSTAPPVTRVREALCDSLARAKNAGLPAEQIVLDPGIGFFTEEAVSAATFNCIVLDRLAELADLGYPLLVGVSRKSFVGKITGRSAPEDRLPGSLAATAVAVYNGAAVIRTHDLTATRDAVRMAEALRAGRAD